MKIVLAGTPNAGKTTLFNSLTHSNLRTGNFHGVTTSPAKKTVGGREYVDVPGAYSFKTYSMEEGSAVKEIASADIVVNVLDATTLESSLNFTRKILSLGKCTIVYVTKCQRLKKRGGRLDKAALSAYLGVPVTDEVKGLKCLLSALPKDVKKDADITLDRAYYGGNLKITRADRLFFNNFFCLFAFVAAIVLMFFLAFAPNMPGAFLKEGTERLISVRLAGAVTAHMKSPPLISLVKEGIFGGVGSVLSFLPQIAILYLFLTFLDECGIAGALSFSTDGIFQKLSLSGRAAFSLASGFGCTAAAILTTRGYGSPSAQKRTVAILPYIPCGAKLPVFLTFLSPLFKNPFPAVTLLYFAGMLAAIAAAAIIRGGGEDMLSEVAPICLPSLKTVVIKLSFYLKGFILKVATTVTVFCLISWFLSHFSAGFGYVPCEKSMLAAVAGFVLPVFKPMGVGDWRIAYALLCGFIAKENIAATIAMLCPLGAGLDVAATAGVCVFVLLSPACVSAFASSCREVGVKFSLKCVAVQFITAFTGAYIAHLLFLL